MTENKPCKVILDQCEGGIFECQKEELQKKLKECESLTQTLVEALEFSKMILGHAIDLGYLNEGSPSFGLANDAIQKTDMALKQFRGAPPFVHDVWEFRDENDQ